MPDRTYRSLRDEFPQYFRPSSDDDDLTGVLAELDALGARQRPKGTPGGWIPTAIRVAPAVVGGIAGGIFGNVPGAMLGGGAGSALGESLAQLWERTEDPSRQWNPENVAFQALLGAIPGPWGKSIGALKPLARVGAQAAIGAGTGALVGGPGAVGSNITERHARGADWSESLPSWEEFTQEMGTGAGVGALVGGVAGGGGELGVQALQRAGKLRMREPSVTPGYEAPGALPPDAPPPDWSAQSTLDPLYADDLDTLVQSIFGPNQTPPTPPAPGVMPEPRLGAEGRRAWPAPPPREPARPRMAYVRDDSGNFVPQPVEPEAPFEMPEIGQMPGENAAFGELERLLAQGLPPEEIRFRYPTGKQGTRGIGTPEPDPNIQAQKRMAAYEGRKAEEARLKAEADAQAAAERQAAEEARLANEERIRAEREARYTGGPYTRETPIDDLDWNAVEAAGIDTNRLRNARTRSVIQSGPEWTRIQTGGDPGNPGGIFDVPTASLIVPPPEEIAARAAAKEAAYQRALQAEAIMRKPSNQVTPEEWWGVLTESERQEKLLSVRNWNYRADMQARMDAGKPRPATADVPPPAEMAPPKAPAAPDEALPPGADEFGPEMFEAPEAPVAPQERTPEGLIPMLLRLENEGQIPPETMDLARLLRDRQPPGVQPARLTARLAGAQEIPAMQAFQPGRPARRPAPVSRQLGEPTGPEIDVIPQGEQYRLPGTRPAPVSETPDLDAILQPPAPVAPPVDVGAPPAPAKVTTAPTQYELDQMAREILAGQPGMRSVKIPDLWDAYASKLRAQGLEPDPAVFRSRLESMKRKGGGFAPADSPRQIPPDADYLPSRGDVAGMPDYEYYYYPPEADAPPVDVAAPPQRPEPAAPPEAPAEIPANVRSYLSKQLGYSQREINALPPDEAIRVGREQARKVRAPEERTPWEEGGIGKFVAPPDRDFAVVQLTRDEAQANPEVRKALQEAGFKYRKPNPPNRPEGEWYLNTVSRDGQEILSQEEATELTRGILARGQKPSPAPDLEQALTPAPEAPLVREPVPPDVAQAGDELQRLLDTGEIGPGLAARQDRLRASRATRAEALEKTKIPTGEAAPEVAYVPPEIRQRAAAALKQSEADVPRPPKTAPTPASRATGELGWAFNVLDNHIGNEVMYLKGQGDFAAVLPEDMIGKVGKTLRRIDDDYLKAMASVEEAARQGNPEALYYFSAHEQTAASRWAQATGGKGTRGKATTDGEATGRPEDRRGVKGFTAFSGVSPTDPVDQLVAAFFSRSPDMTQEVLRRIGYAIGGGAIAGFAAPKDEEAWKYVLTGMAAGAFGKDAMRLLRAARAASTRAAGGVVELKPPRPAAPPPKNPPRGYKPVVETHPVFRQKQGDLNFLEDMFGTTQRNLPEYSAELDAAERAYAKDRFAKTFKGTPEELDALKRKHFGNLIKTLRKDAKNIRPQKPTKARFMEALAKDLDDWKTPEEGAIESLIPRKYQHLASRFATNSAYRMLVGWGVDTAAQNLTQPILALSHVPPKYLHRGFKALASEAMEAGMRGKGASWEQSQIVHLDRPMELSEELLQKGMRFKNPKMQRAVDFMKKWDPMIFLRSTDSWNRRGVFLGATEYATEALGKSEQDAMKWALQIVYKTQGATGRLGGNPHWRGPIRSLLRPFLKFPTMFTEHMYDVLTQPGDLEGKARLLGTIGSLIAASELAFALGMPSVSTENLLVSGGRPLGFDVAHPLRSARRLVGEDAGDAFPVVRGAKRVVEIAQGRSETPVTKDLEQFLIGRYPTKLIDTLTEMQGQAKRDNLWGTHTARTGSGAAVPHTGAEDLMNLLGMKSVRQVKLREAYDDLQDVTASELAAQKRDLSAIKTRVLKAIDAGDLETARQEAAALTKRQRRALISGANRTRFERRLSGMSKDMQRKIREDFGERVRRLELQDEGAR